jgi:Fic family protein
MQRYQHPSYSAITILKRMKCFKLKMDNSRFYQRGIIAVNRKIHQLVHSLLQMFRTNGNVFNFPPQFVCKIILDFLFTNPVFRNNKFVGSIGIPNATAAIIIKKLVDAGLLAKKEESSGRKAALYSFEPLMNLVRV